MNRIWLSLVAAALMAVAAFAPVAAQDTVTIDMKEVDGSGQSGNADITTDGDQVTVSIEIEPGEEGVPQPAHIHEGSCDDLGDVAYPLDDVVDGVSESTAEVGMDELLPGEYAINVHLSEDQMDVYVSCGNLPLIGAAPDGDESEDEEASDEDESAEEGDGETDEASEDDEESTDEGAEDEGTDEDESDGADESEDESAGEDDAEDAAGEEADDVAPATGFDGGPGTEAGIALMLVLAGGALGAGLLVRRRALQA